MPTILAIDQSTSATKAILFNSQGRLLDQQALSHRQIYPQPGWVEHDAEEIYQNTLQVIRILLERNPLERQRLLCLSITNQRETVVVFDRASGRPLYNAIVWQCRRGAALCESLAQQGYETMVQQRTGLKIDTYFSASKLRWLVENEPEIGVRLRNGQALAGTIDAYLIYRLTGGCTFATDHTNASRTLLYNIHTLKWDTELCELFHILPAALPEVRDVDDRFGATDLEGFLENPLPICGVMGDSQAALFGQRGFTPGAAKITFGSGSSILLNTGVAPRQPAQGVVTALAWVLDGQPTYSFEGITNFTGATVNWLRDQLKLIETPEETETLAFSVPDNGGVYLVNAFVGLSAPYWRPEARAAILGLTPSSTRAHVARAALEAIGYLISDVLNAISQQGGVQLGRIHADGGGSRNRFLMQFVTDITRLQVRAARLPELSALGAAMAGGLGMGLYASLDAVQQLPLEFTDYEPGMPGEQAAALYAGWQHAVRQVLAS
jgi:glycerol kinase